MKSKIIGIILVIIWLIMLPVVSHYQYYIYNKLFKCDYDTTSLIIAVFSIIYLTAASILFWDDILE